MLLVAMFGSWRATVKALVPPTTDLAEYCNKLRSFNKFCETNTDQLTIVHFPRVTIY